MNEKNLVVCDSDKQYARKLGETISERKELSLRVFACTTAEGARKFAEERPLDILLIGEDIDKERRREIPAGQVFVLTKGTGTDCTETETPILKYQCADTILGCVFQTYYEKTNQTILKGIKKPRQRLLAVYSPVHRVGCTTFAFAFGRELAKREKVLYLNMEAYPEMESRFSGAEQNLSDLLYYIRQENQDIAMRLASMVYRTEELDCLPPIPMLQDLQSVTCVEWKEVLSEILQKSHYETVLLDLNECVQGLFSILDLCDEIYMPLPEDAASKQKLRQFENNLQAYQMTSIWQKTHLFSAAEDMEACAKRWGKEEQK